ncbi:hypothetical protein BU17DRAFT_77692 [Hysterangium stoloniferum]|nr:hypothetical protein BU17DRAFT_77692 [Hysterangium stoloniferum]
MLPRPVGTTKASIPISSIQTRTYVVSVSPPRVYPQKKTREYSARKTFLLNEYTRLLERNAALLLLTHQNFSVHELIKLRKDIAALKPAPSPSLALHPAPVSAAPEVPRLMVVRTGILGVALRERLDIDMAHKRALARLVTPGALAVLALPSLHPPQLAALMRTLDRAVPPKKPPLTPAQDAEARAAARRAVIENPTPGRRPKRVRPDLPPELEIKGALIEGRLFVRAGLEGVARLPTLDTLRSQLLGLIGAPAMQIAGVLAQAGGGQLARTLEGFRKGLEMAERGEGD